MFLKCKKLLLLTLFVTTALSVDSRAGMFDLPSEFQSLSACQKMMIFIKPTFIGDDEGQLQLGFKIRSWSKAGLGAYDIISLGGKPVIRLRSHSATLAQSAISRYPNLVRNFGFRTRSTLFKSGTFAMVTKLLNENLDALVGTPLEKPFRFVDWQPDTSKNQTQIYPDKIFLENILENHILVATADFELAHDRLGNHAFGIIFMPPRVFENFKSQVRVIFELEKILPNNYKSKIYIRDQKERLMGKWDSLTGRAGGDISLFGIGETSEGPATSHFNDLSSFTNNVFLTPTMTSETFSANLFKSLSAYDLKIPAELQEQIQKLVNSQFVAPPTRQEIFEYLQKIVVTAGDQG